MAGVIANYPTDLNNLFLTPSNVYRGYLTALFILLNAMALLKPV